MRRNGFTLIELLIAISIISILSVIGLVVYQGITSKARDSVRKQDLNKLAMALEIYAQQHNGKYIGGTGTCETDTPIFYHETNGIAPNMSDRIVPKDPQTKTNYCYISVNNGQSYRLFAKLENCNNSGGNLCTYTNYNYSIYSDDLFLASATS